MEWLLGILILLIFIGLLIASPVFRIVILVIVLGCWWWLNEASKEKEMARAKEASLIQPNQLIWSNVKISGGSSWKFMGRVENTSLNTLTEFSAKLSFYDCPSIEAQLKDCKIFHEPATHSYINVPPKQVRDFSEYISQPPSKEQGFLRWTYSISEIKGK